MPARSKRSCGKAAESETPRRTFFGTSQVLRDSRTPPQTVFNVLEIKKSPRPWTDPEDCTRFFILTCSPALEGTMVLGTFSYRFLFRAGLLAHGSSYSPCLPIFLVVPTCDGAESLLDSANQVAIAGYHVARQWPSRVSSPFTAAGPRGIRTLFPYPETINVKGHSRRGCRFLSSSLMCASASLTASKP